MASTRDNVIEIDASGTEERLLDQVLFEGVRGWEIDLHHDNTIAHNVTAYHTDKPSNSLCPNLGDCLQTSSTSGTPSPTTVPSRIIRIGVASHTRARRRASTGSSPPDTS